MSLPLSNQRGCFGANRTNGQPLNLDNIVRRVILPALSPCVICGELESEHPPGGHTFERDKALSM